MAEDDVRLWFGQAYIHLASGDFASAAKCFEHVIKDARDPYASQLAEQRLRWYCIPLEAILKCMQECSTPIDVHLVLADLFAADSQYQASEQQNIIEIVETELAKLTGVMRIGNKIWVKKDILTVLLGKLAQEILRSTKPLSISSWLRGQINCQPLEGFPDHLTLGVVETGLQDYPIKIISKEYAISITILAAHANTLADTIRTKGYPVDLVSYSRNIFPEIPAEYASQGANALKAHLDSRFVEVAAGVEFLLDLLKLNEDHFEDVFLSYPFPLTTETLLCARLFPGQTSHTITQHFRGLASQQLTRNLHLHWVERSYWIAKALESSYYSRAEKYLLIGSTPKSIQAVLDHILPDKEISHQDRSHLQKLLESSFRGSKNVIMIGNQLWLHMAVVKQAIENAYQQLLNSAKPLTSIALLKANLDFGKTGIESELSNIFESLLEKDQRFAYKSGKVPRLWYVVDPSCKDNQAAYLVIELAHTWLSVEEITKRISSEHSIVSPIINLKSDDRFKSFPPDRWGLIDWISINDLAYEYLLGSRKALHEVVIIGLIYQRSGIIEENAIFTPQEDPRFAQDSLNRWSCRHVLTSTELDLLHEELIKYGGSGRKLDILTRQVLHLHPDSTDAQGRLEADERFIHLDGLWFARQAAFYPLTPVDVERIYGILAAQDDYRSAIPLKDLVNQAIGHDGRLTDAPAWLRRDERFKEVHESFWALSSRPTPDFDRSGIGSASVHRPSNDAGTKNGDSGSTVGKLTPRKSRSATGKVPQEPQKKVYITLSHLDVLHGNLRIAGMLKKWIPAEVNNIHFIDEQDYEFIAYIDDTGLILNIREWLEYRGLTYGDKISIQPAPQVEGLFIRRYGERDERVYQEALNHQEIEKLIDEARRVNKDFHDLMIEVMEEFDRPLHREDIYQLVNYQRTASRNTISEILSLPDCPFEELRYFIPVGAGSWKFDRKRKEAYDMKMQELLTENADLQNQLINLRSQSLVQPVSHEKIQVLSEQNEQFQTVIGETNDKVERLLAENAALNDQQINLQAHLDRQQGTTQEKDVLSKKHQQLQTENAELRENLKRILDEKTEIERVNSELRADKEPLEKQTESLRSSNKDNETAMKQIQAMGDHELAELREYIKTLTSEMDGLRTQLKETKKPAARETAEIQAQLSTKTMELDPQLEKIGSLAAELVATQASKESFQKEIEQLKHENAAKTSKLEADLVNAQSSNENMQKYIDRLGIVSASKIDQLKTDLAAAQSSNERMQKEIEQLRQESAAKPSKLEADLANAQSSNEKKQKEIERIVRISTSKVDQLKANLAMAQSSNENMQSDLELLRSESAARISQLENELAEAQKSKQHAQDITGSPAPSKFKKFIQGISKLLFGKKS